MRIWWMLLALSLGVNTSTAVMADDAIGGLEDDPQTETAIRELVSRGAVVKRFTVLESETKGLLVRLKPAHLDRNGQIDANILTTLASLHDLMLELRSLPLSDEGLKPLLAKVKLVGLDASGSEISDRGLRELESVRPQLRLLDLSFTRATDEGLKSVASQSELRHLSLIKCRVTDSATASLSRLRKLRELYLAKTAISPQAVDELKRTLPACRIER